MDIKERDKRLGQFFSKEDLAKFDEAEKNVLSEEFANSELRLLATQGVDATKARVSKETQAEYQRRLMYIQEDEYTLLKQWYLDNCKSVEEIYCTKCGVLLGLEVDTDDANQNSHHHEGKFIVAVGPYLMAYKPRLDGIMGYQCGNVIDNPSKKVQKAWSKFDKDLQEATETFEKDRVEYNTKAEAYNALSDEEKAETEPPVAPSPVQLTPPDEPRRIDCGNDTRWGQIEIDNIPEEHIMTSITKEDRIKVKREMDATNYVPDVKKTKTGRTVESFELRKVK